MSDDNIGIVDWMEGRPDKKRIKELKAENARLERMLDLAVEWIQQDCPFSTETIMVELKALEKE